MRTLVLDANGYTWKEMAADTVVFGLLRARDYEFVPERLRDVRFFRLLKQRYDALGYIADWREALCASPALDVRVCNIMNLVEYRRSLAGIATYDLVVVLHSAAGDSMTFLNKAVRWLRRRRGQLVVFIGNEYDLMAEKIAFLEETRADFVCSQLPIESARWLYAETEARVLPMAHALNPNAYSAPLDQPRPTDVGFAGAMYSPFIGDVERTRLVEAVRERAPGWGLETDIRTSTLPRAEWAGFLGRCKGTIGAESGTYYLDRQASILGGAKSFLGAHPSATFDELREHCFSSPSVEYVSGKCVSSRHFEAIGTRTCQVLLEGEYNGILEPDVHYISVNKDLSNLDDAIDRFKDASYRREIADRAFEYAMDAHTHAHRVASLVAAVA